jgi:hypothetical protein
MPIYAKEEITIPAKSFNKLWATQIEIYSPSPLEESSAIIRLVPLNDAGEMHLLGAQTIQVRDILTRAQANPDSNLAKAMYFLLLAIDDEYKAVTQ